MSEESNTQPDPQQSEATAEESQVETQDQERSDEIIPVEWEVARETYELRQEQVRVQEYISRFLLEMEKQKADLLSRLAMIENRVFECATDIRDQMNIDPSSPYELKLPDAPGEKAYFVRKQQD